MELLDRYYEKFNEEKRLGRRHGQVEFFVTMTYIRRYLSNLQNPKIADIGAGTGVYALPLSANGFDVTAVELVESNLKKLRAKQANIKTYLGDATKLSMFNDSVFDFVLLLGPMYHLQTKEQKVKALLEAKRISKNGAIIFVAYYMNDYAIIKHGFTDGNIIQSVKEVRLDEKFHILPKAGDIYTFDRIEDINQYNAAAGLNREVIFAPDGASDYMRGVLNQMDSDTFEFFKQYQLSVCERQDMLGASSHIVDVLKVRK